MCGYSQFLPLVFKLSDCSINVGGSAIFIGILVLMFGSMAYAAIKHW